MDRRYTEIAFCPTQPDYAIDVFKAKKDQKIVKSSQIPTNEINKIFLDAEGWLPFAAEQYEISASLKDYIMVPVIIMPSDLPNRNGVGFPFSELSKFCPDTGTMVYQTWKGMPVYYEHKHVPSNIKGVVFSSLLRPIKNVQGDLWKVVCLLGVDRKRDPHLANRILTKDISSYSMGAYVRDYRCTVCGSLESDGGCEHVKIGKPKFDIFNTKIGPKLGYLEAIDPKGFEVSCVETPAYMSAYSDFMLEI
jgi:hypothetical protein